MGDNFMSEAKLFLVDMEKKRALVEVDGIFLLFCVKQNRVDLLQGYEIKKDKKPDLGIPKDLAWEAYRAVANTFKDDIDAADAEAKQLEFNF